MTLVGLGLLAGGVFKSKSNDGLLVVQVNEPNANIFVDGDPLTATWRRRQDQVLGEAGNHQVEVKKRGLQTTAPRSRSRSAADR